MGGGDGGATWRQGANPMEGSGAAGSGGVEPHSLGPPGMIQLTPQMRILVAVEAVEFREGIDSLDALCRHYLPADPVSGHAFVVPSWHGTPIKALVYDVPADWLAA